jgi:hypothetical protein
MPESHHPFRYPLFPRPNAETESECLSLLGQLIFANTVALPKLPSLAPVPLCPPLVCILPWLIHRCHSLGLHFESSFLAPADWPIWLESAALRSFRQQRCLAEIMHNAQAQSLPLLLIKGAALANIYPNPLLRSFADLDVATTPTRYQQTEWLLLETGWKKLRPTHKGSLWIHPLRINLDLQIISNRRGRIIWQTSQPLNQEFPCIRQPHPSASLVLALLHNAGRGWKKTWRDLLDCFLLLQQHPEVVSGVEPYLLNQAERDAAYGLLAVLKRMTNHLDLIGLLPQPTPMAESYREFHQALLLDIFPSSIYGILQAYAKYPAPFIRCWDGMSSLLSVKGRNHSGLDEWYADALFQGTNRRLILGKLVHQGNESGPLRSFLKQQAFFPPIESLV